MAVLIKGMNFPKTCIECDLEIVDDDDCTIYCLICEGYTSKCREDGRLPDCPLVEVCEDCHRKYMNWEILKSAAEGIANKIVKELEK